MIKVRHFENGVKLFETDKEFLSWANLIFAENEEGDDTLTPPQDIEEAARYIAHYCQEWDMFYYQPSGEIDHYSFEVYLQKENAEHDYPSRYIGEYTNDDIEDFSVIDM
jgi:hypothetical protein